MSLSKAFEAGKGSIVIIDDNYLPIDPDNVSGDALGALLRALKVAPEDCKALGVLLALPENTGPSPLVDAVGTNLPMVYAAYLSGDHPYLQVLFADLEENKTADLRRLKILESELTGFFKVRPKVYGSLDAARADLSDCSLVFVDFFLGGVRNQEEARSMYSSVKNELSKRFQFEKVELPKLVVLMSSSLPDTSVIADFRRDTGVRGAFFHAIDKATFRQEYLRDYVRKISAGYESASKLDSYLHAVQQEITRVAETLADELQSRLDVHDLTILKTLRLDGESDTPQAYLTHLLSEVLAARVRIAPALRSEVLPKSHTYGEAPFDGKLLPSSVLFEFFADIAVAPTPLTGSVQVAFGDIFEATAGEQKGSLYLAISPACDLQRCSPEYEVLCVPGTVEANGENLQKLFVRQYNFGQGSVVMKIQGDQGVSFSKITFDVKMLRTIRASVLNDAGGFRRLARMSEIFAQEIKTLALNYTSRIGIPIDPSFSIGLKAKIRFLFTVGQNQAPIQGEYDVDHAKFLPAVLAMGREPGDPRLQPTVMFSSQFKEILLKILSDKLAESHHAKLVQVTDHFSKADSFKVVLDPKKNYSKSFDGLITIRYMEKLSKLGSPKNFEILLFNELEEDEDSPENGAEDAAAVVTAPITTASS